MLSLYLLAILVSIMSLAGWIYNQNKKEELAKRFQMALFAGLGLYLISIFTLPAAALSQKVGFVFRDLLVIAISGANFSLHCPLQKGFLPSCRLDRRQCLFCL